MVKISLSLEWKLSMSLHKKLLKSKMICESEGISCHFSFRSVLMKKSPCENRDVKSQWNYLMRYKSRLNEISRFEWNAIILKNVCTKCSTVSRWPLSSAWADEKESSFSAFACWEKVYEATRKIFLSLKSPMRLFFFNLVANDKVINSHS